MVENRKAEAGMLEAVQVCAGYDARAVLRDVSVVAGAGEMLGLIGPNGSGKTTLLRVLSGFLPCRSGQVKVAGRALDRVSRRELARALAFVPQAIEMPVAYTVEDVVAMGRTPYVPGWAPLSARDREVVRGALAAMDLEALAERPMNELSAGERQRAVVAMALAQEPRILLLDEPVAHLDIQHAWKLMETVSRMNREQELTVVVSLHDLNLAARFCPRLLLLDGGGIAASGTCAQVLDEEILRRVYRHPIETIRREDGSLILVPGAK
ncbi:MAG: Iron(3+)-hydroxamate import ATP-binding protein FhuC [Verrucomicrobia bacterium ADurb.Bin345]|nr:MAG: Iron(3+)-hydroxamate import ATP-binding protein FhuC [Verrucomicrobia bacterium ADurb.Bin345]